MDLDPNDPSELKRMEALRELGSAAAAEPEERHQRMQHAWKILEEAVALNPHNNRARFLLVSCLMNNDDFRRAKMEGLKIYDSLSFEQRRRMGDAVLHISLAHSSKMLGELEDAVKFAAEASEAYPHDPHPHMILGELYEAMDENHKAEKKCRETLMYQNEPECKHPLSEQSVYFTLCCLGASLIKQEKLTEAERFLAQATELSSTSTLAFRHLVDVYDMQGRYEDALHVARHMETLDPEDDEIRQKIIILEEQEDHFDPDARRQAELSDDLKMPNGRAMSDTDQSGRGVHGGRLYPGSAGGSVKGGSVRSARSHHSQRSQGSRRSHRGDKGGYPDTGRDAPSNSEQSHLSQAVVEKRDRRDSRSTPRDRDEDKSDFLCCCFDRPSSSNKDKDRRDRR